MLNGVGAEVKMLGATLVAAALGLSGVPNAHAHDHRPPKTTLRHRGDSLQRGHLMDACWTYASPDAPGEYVTSCEDGVWHFSEVDKVRTGARVRIRFHKVQEPGALRIDAYKRVDDNDVPQGKKRSIDFELEAVVDPDGQSIVAWETVFRVSNRVRHYYLDVAGRWKDEEGSNYNQSARWTFHIKTKS